MFKPVEWPHVSRSAEDIKKFYGVSPLGLDLEWNITTERPTILGLSDGITAVSCDWDAGKPYLIELLQKYPKTVLVGHNVVRSDIFVLEGEGITVDLANVEDTIIRFWLTNMHLCKTTQKAALDTDEGERRGRGFMNLGTMCSVYTTLPYWKTCRYPENSHETCDAPCPRHDPFMYNGVDSLGPVAASFSGPYSSGATLRHHSKLRGVEKLYPMHRELAYVLEDMSRFGVMTDVEYVHSLRGEFEVQKRDVGERLPFNADSHMQIKDYFAGKLILESGGKLALENAQEQTIREAVESLGIDPYEDDITLLDSYEQMLVLLLEYKELGNGPDRWFEPLRRTEKGNWIGFVHEDGFIHPHLGFFTSSARMMCSNPNLQNVAKRRLDRRRCACEHEKRFHDNIRCLSCRECTGFKPANVGKKIRRGFIAPPGYYMIRADYSNAENRVVLTGPSPYAGYTIPRDRDLHEEVVKIAGITPDMPFSLALGGPRDAAKSIQHAGNYLEGLQLLTPGQLNTARMKREIEVGARTVYPDWRFQGRVVTFTGANLAGRAFGKKSFENRAKALQIADKYFGNFPGVRKWQQHVTKQIETEGVIRPLNGYYLLSYGYAEDRIKQAAAVWGSQPVAHLTKLALLNLHRRWRQEQKMVPVLQVHDEIICYARDDVPPDVAARWIVDAMEIETEEMPGFVIPAEPSYGSNWAEQKKMKL